MCGIFGYVGYVEPQYREMFHTLLSNLAWFSEERGTHATGFAGVMQDGRVVADKMPLRGSVFTEFSKKWQDLKEELPVAMIAHTRYGTGSSPMVNNNNHPFFGNDFHMVHNGTINAWQQYIKQHDLADKMMSETDSEVILRLFEKRRAENKETEPLKKSVEWLLETIWGNMAVALLDLNEKGSIWLFRNDNPIIVFEIPEGMFGPGKIVMFCSTYKIFNGAWEVSYKAPVKDWTSINWMSLNENQLYKLTAIGELSNENVFKNFLFYRIDVKRRFYRQLTTWNDGYRYGPGYGASSSTINLEGPRTTVINDLTIREVVKKEYYSKAVAADKQELAMLTSDKIEIRKLMDQPKAISDEVRVDGMPASLYMKFNAACKHMVKFDEQLLVARQNV